jgi:hypothetical protein
MKVILLLITLSLFASASFAKDVSTIENQQIAAVFNKFFKAIEEKDESLFLSLFTDKDVSWVGVISQDTHALLTKKNPAFAKQPRAIFETPKKFIRDIANNSKKMRESYSNVQVIEDGDVAKVSFDYIMHQDGFKKNWGQENWLLIFVEGRWKIHAVNFSLTLNPELFGN